MTTNVFFYTIDLNKGDPQRIIIHDEGMVLATLQVVERKGNRIVIRAVVDPEEIDVHREKTFRNIFPMENLLDQS